MKPTIEMDGALGHDSTQPAAPSSKSQSSFQSPQTEFFKPDIPSITLPKGGGAIRGIDEQFKVNAANGTASFSMPIPIAPSRQGFSPSLSLNYNSGSGNSSFGLGWSLSLTSIRRKIDKKLPRYLDHSEQESFTLSGLEELVPFLDPSDPLRHLTKTHTESGVEYRIERYRLRIEGGLTRIEKWVNSITGTFHWRTTTPDNVSSVYGLTPQARIVDPENENRVFEWLVEKSFDSKGNCIEFIYKEENLDSIEPETHEAQRLNGKARFVNRYIKKVLYGNTSPVIYRQTGPDITAVQYLFQTVFDYGEHQGDSPTPDEDILWSVREDAFSDYRAGFEIRSWRRCQRVLLFHQFEELGPEPRLIRSMELDYGDEMPGFSFLKEVRIKGHIEPTVEEDGDRDSLLPPMSFNYQQHEWSQTVKTLDPRSYKNLPVGIDQRNYQWVDLYGEGLNGVLTEQGSGLYYKQNLGDGTFGKLTAIDAAPSIKGLQAGSLQVQDLEANGRWALVSYGPTPGFFERDEKIGWKNFDSFKELPTIGLNDPNGRFIDLDGDGRADLLITEENLIRWYPSAGKQGFRQSQTVPNAANEKEGSKILFSDSGERIALADMCGDGLQDIVRVRNGRIDYWPNLGYGRFGALVTMSNSPYFDRPDQFNQNYIQFVDLDGSGTTDIAYLGKNEFRFWLNSNGNGFSQASGIINPFPDLDSSTQVAMFDLLGTGTACIVWSSPLPTYRNQPLRYIDLMGSKKPHVLTGYKNNMGREVALSYKPSTHYYLEASRSGKPWVTKLHFLVQCLAKVETFDHITGLRFASEYAYYHGFYDHAEREFRGFGRVDQVDTEEFENFALNDASNVVEQSLRQPPVMTKTWFHTGAFIDTDTILDQFADEYYKNEAIRTHPLSRPILPEGLTAQEWREALRACKGMTLRSEVYGLDGSLFEPHPYSVSESTVDIGMVQPKSVNQYACFQVLGTESISYQYDRNPADPRINHTLTLEFDELGLPLKTASIGYPRLGLDDEPLPREVMDAQANTTIAYQESDLTHDIDPDSQDPKANKANGRTTDYDYRLRQAYQNRIFEVTGVAANQDGYYTREFLVEEISNATEIEYHHTPLVGAEKRLLSHSRIRYLADNLSNPLELGTIEPLGIPWQSFQLAMTPTLVEHLYGDRVDEAMLESGGYIHSRDANGVENSNWWVPSGTAIYKADAERHFYQPAGMLDPFGNASLFDYDNYDFIVVRSEDAKQNVVSAEIDYQTLQPRRVIDSNLNYAEVGVDQLGMVVRSAVAGKNGEGDTLQEPTTKLEYSFSNWMNHGKPNYVITHTRETHQDPSTRWLTQYEYSDGGGNVVMVKTQAEPGKAKQLNVSGQIEEIDTTPNLRWVGNGRTVFNNKGNPVKQYEPYFSVTPEYEDAAELVETGPTQILFYDATGRGVGSLNPNHTFQKTRFDPWKQSVWDANDTLLIDNPADDEDIGAFFESLQESEYLPTWYSQRIDGALGTEEQRAARMSEAHADTPGIAYTDPLGRTIYGLADNGALGKYKTRTVLDIEGDTLAVVDNRDNAVMAYRHNMLPPPDAESPKPALYQDSMDGGEKWTLMNVLGQPIWSWDSRDHRFENRYDELQRPTEVWVTEGGQRKLVGLTRYVDSNSPDAEEARLNNLIGAAFEGYDQTGRSRTVRLDFKGNQIEAVRALARDYKESVDWNVPAPHSLLEIETFTNESQYDALNRIVYSELPHNQDVPASTTRPTYNESGALDKMHVSVRGGGETIYVENIDYDAKGQRARIEYGNGVVTVYDYEEVTYRLRRLNTYKRSSPGVLLQDLSYTYDPVGNITEIRDDAQQETYFRNQRVEPASRYEYDPLYRLTSATGREHATQAGFPSATSGWQPLVRFNDDSQMRSYTQTYQYDSVGNILNMVHALANGNTAGWTRHYDYDDNNNRLLATTLSDPSLPFKEIYTYNAHGSMASMPHLPTMDWDFAEQLRHIDLKGGGQAYYVYDAGGQRTRKVIETNGSTVKERIYLGGWEIYRVRTAGQLKLEREALHVMDDQSRIALIETKMVDGANLIANPSPIVRYQLGNHLGSASLELSDGGDVISYEEFHPYGTTAYHAGTSVVQESAKRYRYTGKERDRETGFSYHGERYYAAWLGRWTAKDLDGLVDGMNLYQYVSNQVINYVDIDGNKKRKSNNDEDNRKWEKKEIRKAKLELRNSNLFRDLERRTKKENKQRTKVVSLSRLEDFERENERIEQEINEELIKNEQNLGRKLSEKEKETYRQIELATDPSSFVERKNSSTVQLIPYKKWKGRHELASTFRAENKIELYKKGKNKTLDDLVNLLAHEYSHLFDPTVSKNKNAGFEVPFIESEDEIFAELFSQLILCEVKGQNACRVSQLNYVGEIINLGNIILYDAFGTLLGTVEDKINQIYQSNSNSQQKAEEIHKLVKDNIVK